MGPPVAEAAMFAADRVGISPEPASNLGAVSQAAPGLGDARANRRQELAWLMSGGEPAHLATPPHEGQVVEACRMALAEWQALPVVLGNLLRWMGDREPPGEAQALLDEAIDRQIGFSVLTDVQMQLAAQVVERFDAAGIEHVLMKGSAARLCAYADPSLRLGKDFDFAVPRNALGAAELIAVEMGFVPAEWDYDTRHFHFADMRLRRSVEERHYELGFLALRQRVLGLEPSIEAAIRRDIPTQYIWHELPDGSLGCYVTIDIHHGISLDISAAESIASAQAVDFDGTRFHVPAPDWLAFQLIFKLYWEGVHNYRKGAYQYADLARIIPALGPTDLASLREIVAHHRLEAGAYYVLRRLPTALATPLPDHVVAYITELSSAPAKGDPIHHNDFGDHWPKIWGGR